MSERATAKNHFVCLSVCLTVTLVNHAWFRTSIYVLHHTIERCFYFRVAEICVPEFKGFTFNECDLERHNDQIRALSLQ